MDRLLLGELFLGLGSAVLVFFLLRGSLRRWRLQKTRKTWQEQFSRHGVLLFRWVLAVALLFWALDWLGRPVRTERAVHVGRESYSTTGPGLDGVVRTTGGSGTRVRVSLGTLLISNFKKGDRVRFSQGRISGHLYYRGKAESDDD